MSIRGVIKRANSKGTVFSIILNFMNFKLIKTKDGFKLGHTGFDNLESNINLRNHLIPVHALVKPKQNMLYRMTLRSPQTNIVFKNKLDVIFITRIIRSV